MKQRCYNSNATGYKNYGGRGIIICDRWRYSFENFLSDMGEKPARLTLDRKNNAGNYCKNNCRWITRAEQLKNTRRSRPLTFDGQTLCLRDWERKLGLGYGTLWRRLDAGTPLSLALRPIK